MDRLAFTAAAAITEQTLARQHMVNELANMSTVGFKRSYEVAMQSITAEGSGFSSRIQPKSVAKDIIRLDPGSLMVTGRPLDIAMNHSTVMGVTAPDGNLAFTRRGDLRVNANGVLEVGSGHLVRGENGPINVPPGFEIRINPDGTIFARDPGQAGVGGGQQVGRLLLRDAANTPLLRRTDGLFSPEGKPAGSDITGAGPQLVSVTTGALEGANVGAIQAMVKLMDHSRSFEQQIRIIKESRNIDESGATMLRAPQ